MYGVPRRQRLEVLLLGDQAGLDEQGALREMRRQLLRLGVGGEALLVERPVLVEDLGETERGAMQPDDPLVLGARELAHLDEDVARATSSSGAAPSAYARRSATRARAGRR